jgi:hypothetical protein
MKRLLLTVLVLASIPTARASDPLGPVTSVRQQSEPDPTPSQAELLDGREAVVRLYDRWRDDPKAYVTLGVPLQGSDVTFDAVRLACARTRSDGAAVPVSEQSAELSDQAKSMLDQELKDAVVAVVPGDQEDAVIAGAMEGCIFGEPYRSGGRFGLLPGPIPPVQLHSCLFKDALQQPIPNVEVEILLADYPLHHNARIKLWIGNARLDENGRMQSPKTSGSCSVHCFLFVVIHPDCGPVPAQWNYALPAPGADALFTAGALPRDRWCTFLDALGNPIPGARVDVFDGGWAWPRSSAPMDSIILDGGGGLRPPHWRPLLDRCCFRAYDPNYGIGIVEPYDKMYRWPEVPLTTCVVPLVSIETEAAQRSIWGTVIDANDQPVTEAVISCSEIMLAGGGGLPVFFEGSLSGKCAKVLTDSQGRFAMHVPLARQDGTLGRPVPPGAQYAVTVEAPTPLGLAPYHGSLPAGQEHTITLWPPSPEPKAFTGTLIFQDEFGPVTDPQRLRLITLTIFSLTDKSLVGSYPVSWIEPKELPFGIYSATVRWDGKLYVFEPVEVTPESPQIIVFRPAQIKPATKVYYGRVIHGITGAPVGQVVVMPMPFLSSSYDGLKLPPEYMDQLHDFGPEIDPDGELLRILQQEAGIEIVRTGPDGRYEITLPVPGEVGPPDRIVAVRKDFLGAQQELRMRLPGVDENGLPRLEDFQVDRLGRVMLPDMKLLPAGTVLIEPNKPGEIPDKADVRFYYSTAPDDPTPWLKDLWASPQNNKGGSVFRTYELRSNLLQSVYVPAHVTLTLTVQVLDQRCAPVIIEGVRLEQGQVLDLGRVDFTEAIQVAVKVIDSAGNPLESIVVRHLDERGGYRGQQVVTEGGGVAFLYVPPHSQGQFAVEFRPAGAQDSIREGIPYQIGGAEDAGREFILLLSDAFVKQLFDSQTSR